MEFISSPPSACFEDEEWDGSACVPTTAPVSAGYLLFLSVCFMMVMLIVASWCHCSGREGVATRKEGVATRKEPRDICSQEQQQQHQEHRTKAAPLELFPT